MNELASTLSATHLDEFKLRPVLISGSPSEIIHAVGQIRTATGMLADEYAFAPPASNRWYPGSLGTHHERVIIQSRTHFPVLPESLGMSRPLLDLTIALHDIGKRTSITALETYAKRDAQKTYTLRLIESVRDDLPIEGPAYNRMRAVISTSAHGELFQGEISPSQAAANIRKGAHLANMQPRAFLRLMTTFNQADVAAYTVPGGGPARLDHVFTPGPNGAFIRDRTDTRLLYSPRNEAKFAKLEQALDSYGQRRR